MTARERWPALWHFFDVLHQDYRDEFPDADACLRQWTAEADDARLREALMQWHSAFDDASEDDTADIVTELNQWWDADREFGGARAWADCVRRHLESELERRVSG